MTNLSYQACSRDDLQQDQTDADTEGGEAGQPPIQRGEVVSRGSQEMRSDTNPDQEDVIKPRLNFAPAPSKLPLTDTMAAVESGARRLSLENPV